MLDHRVQRRHQYSVRRNWKEVMASFVVIACFIGTIIFVSAWNRSLAGRGKQFRGDPQKGPYGLPETEAPAMQETPEQDVRVMGRAAVEPSPKTTLSPQPPVTTEQTVALESSDRDEATQGDMYRAPQVMSAAKGAAPTHCTTTMCHTLKEWFVGMVGDQADPCKERNTFVCDASTAFPSFHGEPTKDVSSHGRDGESTSASRKAPLHVDGAGDLTRLCLQYARDPTAGAEDILSFLSHFNLDLRHMEHDPKEEPLSRMMELSLEYGVDGPVSFTQKYKVAGQSSEPFLLQIDLNPEEDHFLWALESMEPEGVKSFYELCLFNYAHLNDSFVTELLLDADDEIGDVLNKTTDSGHLKKMTIGDLYNHTGVQAERWAELVATYGHFEPSRKTEVEADERALSLVAYLSRPGSERLAMRQVLAWHVLRGLVAPKVDLLKALNQTRSEDDDEEVFMPSPEVKCEGLVAKIVGVPFAALDLFAGKNAVPVGVISEVTDLMTDIQNVVTSAFIDSRNVTASWTAPYTAFPAVAATHPSKKVALFPNSAGTDPDRGNLFAALVGPKKGARGLPLPQAIGEERSFPLVWLRHLRAWYALPPLMQALLPAMTSVVNVDSPANFFRPPYYAGKAFPAYNFAALGQIVAQAIVHELFHQRHADGTGSERWQRFWDSTDAAEYNSTYCLEASFNQNDTWREIKLQESGLTDRARLDHMLGTRIARLAFPRKHRANNGSDDGWTAELPGVQMSNKQLFDIMHCAFSCAMMGGYDALRVPHHHACMVVYQTVGRFIDRPCGKPPKVNVLNECRYI